MRIGRKNTASLRSVRHAIVVALLLLLPFLTVLGALAPGLVTIRYEDEEAAVPYPPESYPVVQLAHRALLTAREYSDHLVPRMVDLEKLFVTPRYRIQTVKRPLSMATFPRSRGEVIVMGDVNNHIADTLFEDGLQPGVVADATAVWDPNLFDVIPDTTQPGKYGRYDDFMGAEELDETPPPIVPEPGTASLLALGLIGLALRARQRQPAIS